MIGIGQKWALIIGKWSAQERERLEDRDTPYGSSQDQRKIPFPPEMPASHLPAAIGSDTSSVLPPGEVRTSLTEGGAGAQC